MAYAKDSVIKTDDLGKVLNNNDAEIANYNLFAITISAPVGINVYTTVIYARDSGVGTNKKNHYNFAAPNVYPWKKTCIVCHCYFDIELSASTNTFSISGCQYTDDNSHNVDFTIVQIRGIM